MMDDASYVLSCASALVNLAEAVDGVEDPDVQNILIAGMTSIVKQMNHQSHREVTSGDTVVQFRRPE
jgi:hypothetical protein